MTPNPGGQQEGEHGVVHYVQGEHFQRKVKRSEWSVIVSGPVGNPKVILSPYKKSKIYKPKSKLKILGIATLECKSGFALILCSL